MKYQLLEGDNIAHLKSFPDNHFDSIVTDPPYGISFLSKDWDSKKVTATTSKIGALHNLPSGMKHTSLADDLEFQNWMRNVFAECLRVLKPGGHLVAFSAARTYHHMAMAAQTSGFEVRDQLMWIYSSGFPKSMDVGKNNKLTEWEGWGTSLKPAHEPIVLARKPIKTTVAVNVKKWSTGALNIDATRVEERFPSNVIGEIENYQKYFYCPKVSKRERSVFEQADNTHPTVKPVELMKYLIKLITPPNGRVLDPFNGSGSTGMAAVELDYDYTGIDLDHDYIEISRQRIESWYKHTHPTTFGALFK